MIGIGTVADVALSLAHRLVAGSLPPVRLAAPVVVLGYVTLISKGEVTTGDWVSAGLCAGFALLGGRFPLGSALGQAGLLAVVQLLSGLGMPPHKDVSHAMLVGAPLVNGSTSQPVLLMASVALIELAARRPSRQALAAGAALAGVQLGVAGFRDLLGNPLPLAYQLTFTVVAPILLGAYLQSSLRAYQQAKAAAAAADERRREAERAARQIERTEVAREIHDLIAHHVASIALRTAVAQEVLPDVDPRLTAVLDEVHTAATTALADLRKLVAVLRDPDALSARRPAQFGPVLLEPADLPESLATILDGAAAAGLSVRRAVDPEVAGLDAVRALAVLRTVQEGLTNVTRHAGRCTQVHVVVGVCAGQVEIDIVDQGSSAARAVPAVEAAPGVWATAGPHAGGHGLIGLSERMAMLGGSLWAGPNGSGWRITARLPIQEPDPSASDPSASDPSASDSSALTPRAGTAR